MTPTPTRFMLAVCGPSGPAYVVAAVIIAYAMCIARLTPAFFGQVLAVAMVLQLFAASTGYRWRLRRGHFDPLLVRTSNRWHIAVAHWLVSIAPGAAVWTGLTAIEAVAIPNHWPEAARPAVLILFVYVSTMTWALSAVTGRFGGAVAWLATLIALNVSGAIGWFRVSFIGQPDSLGDTARSIASALVVPVSLIVDPEGVSFTILALMSAATAIAWGAGAVFLQQWDAVVDQS